MRVSRIQPLPSHVGSATRCSLKAVSWNRLPWGERWAGCPVQVRGRERASGCPCSAHRSSSPWPPPVITRSELSFIYLWVCAQLLSRVKLFATPWTVLSMGFPRQEIPIPFSDGEGGLPDSGIEPGSPALACRFFTTAPPRKSKWNISRSIVLDSVTPWTLARQVPLSIWFPRQGTWSG